MKSKVFFVPVTNDEVVSEVAKKLERLIAAGRVFDALARDATVAVKLHFGEQGNTGFVNPAYLAIVVKELKKQGARPFVSDTNTLYKGKRTNSKDHLALAYEHGFTPEAIGAEVIIPDDTRPENIREIRRTGTYVKLARIAGVFHDADAIVGVAHFKGHIMTGFGGALKNVGMGCATRSGKLFQHGDIAPFVVERRCKGCKACSLVCPAQAIVFKDEKAVIDPAKCIGCASCIAACTCAAIDVKWEAGGDLIQQKMVEYAAAVLANKKGKAVFLNFCTKITAECDCLAKDDPRIAPDVGILASVDPVAIDKASLDLSLEAAGADVFKNAHPARDGMRQLEHAFGLKLGNVEYEIVRV
ncbi:MAG: DUF362 domain-containing protein [Candidatus Omnitrophica bacterium]|nr:DUF362 domain-containing protein [Candidatus Omnitrophota bacterium]